MIEVRRTADFDAWLRRLRDRTAGARIMIRIDRLVRRGETLVILLCGGDKSSQSRDIARAKTLAKETRD